MVEELISDRRRLQAEQIFALNDCARRAMDAGQFNAAVGAFRVIAEIGGGLTGHALSKDSAAVGNWLTPQRGGCIAAGVRGPFTGKGYNLGIIDDPYKGPEDAKSALERERLIDWLKSVWFTRAEPGLTAEGALLPAAQLWCRPAGTTKR